MKRLLCALIMLLLSTNAAPAQNAERESPGVFALADGTRQTLATLTATSVSPLRADLVLAFYRQNGDRALLRTFDTELGRKLHLIAVSDDLHTTFLHLHPELGADGRFRTTLSVPKPGLYHLYADAVPHDAGHQVFRFDAAFGTPQPSPHPRDTQPTPRTVVVGPYTVTLNSLLLDTKETATLIAHVAKNGTPADDLQPYLGAPAHAIFINARDLSYLHVHPLSADAPPGEMHDMQMPQTKAVAPSLIMHVRVPQADAYKLWLQFQGGGRTYVAPFVLVAH